ncbi:hypothetical protein [Desulfovibrio cuneatus]|uniref:hypothetical protein n=1 Tax=Desulfovibrio cuneatus TaxID=159728 RepID=UPI0003FE1818|nr:hypothetical protein [Desulfovibrio cuneatus]
MKFRLYVSGIVLLAMVCGVGAFAHAASPAPSQKADEREVVATGVGATEDAAKRQAYRSAIQNVIGAMVVAETLVENDAVVRDNVLSHSDGYITKVVQVGKTRPLEGGLVEVTMRVTVKSDQLKEKLKAENIALVAVDGESLFVKKATTQEKAKDAAGIIADAIKDLPASLITAKADTEKAQIETSGTANTVTIPMTVSVDMPAFKKFTTDLKSTATQLGFDVKPMTAELKSRDCKDSDPRFIVEPHPLLWKWRKEKELFTIAIAEMADCASLQSRWSIIPVSKEVVQAFSSFPQGVVLQIDLLDEAGAAVVSQRVPFLSKDRDDISWDIARLIERSGVVAIAPTLRSTFNLHEAAGKFSFGGRGSDKRQMPVTFLLSDAELRAVKGVQTKVINAAPAVRK